MASNKAGAGGRGRAGALLGVALLAAAVALAALSLSRNAAPAQTAADPQACVGEGGIDWDALRATNPDVVAWVSVGGTSIDMPVVQPTADEPDDWYLTHAWDGTYDAEGAAYLDVRAQADSGARLVFGHHVGDTGRMFSEVCKAYRQAVFDGLGELEWSTPDGATKTLRPLMAMSVDKSYEGIQTFGFVDERALREWLTGLLADASAASADAEGIAAGATDVVTLCTCSSDTAGQRPRTLVVFAG